MNANLVPEIPPLILVINDDQSLRMLLHLAMEQEGYQVTEAKNGEEGLAAYRQNQPDLVLLEAVMLVMDGFTCCTQLRNLPNNERTSVLMITVLDDPESVEQAFEVGATDYISKPINWVVLRHRVRHLIQHSLQMRYIASLLQQLEAANQELHQYK